MANDLIPISNFAIGMEFNDEVIKKIRYDTNKRTGTDYIFVRTDTGDTYVMKQTSKGVKRKTQVHIPDYDSKKARKQLNHYRLKPVGSVFC